MAGGEIGPSAERSIVHLSRKGAGEARRLLVGESPLLIEIGESHYVLMRTPGHDRELALGFLFSEALISGPDDVEDIVVDRDKSDVIRVHLGPEASSVDLKRHMIVNSSCGLCGRDGIYELVAGIEPIQAPISVDAEVLFQLPSRVRKQQTLFEDTGGCHAAALFDVGGRIEVVREDIGRHNALDKVLGAALSERIDLSRRGVFLSGRASLEMVIKAGRAGVGLIAAVSASSEAAADAAHRLSMTLCGFVRGDEVAVYTHASRVRST